MIDLAFRNYKSEIIRINLSTPFLVKNRCKECGSHPSIYYYIRNRNLWLDPRRVLKDFDILKKYYKRMCSDHYMMLSPKYFTDLGSFSHQVGYKGFLPKLHRSRGRSIISNIAEFLMCECGATSWAYADKAVINCPEIANRKARSKYPQKFEF
jgi:hypothetical protein